MRWGLLSVWVAAIVMFALVALPASAATAPQVSAQGVVILVAGGDPLAMPAAQLPGDGAISSSRWRSSKEAPVARVQRAWTVAQSDQTGASARVVLRGVSLFGGEVRLRGLRLLVSQPAGGEPVVNLRAPVLVVDGARVALPDQGGDPVALADWGQLTVAASVDGGLAALRLQLVADHGGLAAGSEIDLGLVAFAPPPQQQPPPPTDTGGDAGGGGGSGQGGGPVPAPTHAHHQHQHHAAHHPQHAARHHRRHRVIVHHPARLPQLGRGVRARIVRAAAGQVGWPYVWGGESRAEGGFDCSGLVDYAYSASGHPLAGRPTAAVLWQMGIPIERSQLRPGDLAFLGAPSGDPYHVALYAGHGMVIVASGRNHPIAVVPLDSVPWDGFARIWADGGPVTPPPPHPVPPAASPRAHTAVPGLRAVAVASGPVATARVTQPSVTHDRPAPPRQPAGHAPDGTATADLRIRVAPPPRPAGLPTA